MHQRIRALLGSRLIEPSYNGRAHARATHKLQSSRQIKQSAAVDTDSRIHHAMSAPRAHRACLCAEAQAQGRARCECGAALPQQPPPQCVVCLDHDGVLIQSGCGCRGDAGWVHGACKIAVAVHSSGGAFAEPWYKCATCRQGYTGELVVVLAEEAWRRHKTAGRRGAGSRMAAQANLGNA